jgi:hypothetical protein
MGILNIRVIAQLDAELFSRMEPAQQAEYIDSNSSQPEALKELYPRAKDAMIRFMIVAATRDTDLADRLFASLSMDDKYVRLKLLPYISSKSKEEAKKVAMQFFNDYETAINVINHLSPYESRALLQSVQTMGLPMNEHIVKYLQDSLKREPLTDTDDL